MGKDEVEAAITALEAWARTIDSWVLVFSALVVIGVAGELWAGIAHWRVDVQLRPLRSAQSRFHDIEIKSLEKTSGEANARAFEAQLALEKLKAPRSLTVEQQDAIASALSKFKGQPYWLMSPTSGLDIEPLLTMLNKVLDKAGWVMIDPPGLKIGTPPHGVGIIPEPGIHVAVAPSQKNVLSAAANALKVALNGANIVADAFLDPEAEKIPIAIAIMIGLKPQ